MIKTCFVTGASRGLGSQTGQAALQAGHRLVATARRKESLNNLPGETMCSVSVWTSRSKLRRALP